MTPAGYMAKREQKPKGFHVDGVADVYSVSGLRKRGFCRLHPVLEAQRLLALCFTRDYSDDGAGEFYSTRRNVSLLLRIVRNGV
jgi:hypothetical protein